MIIGIHFSIFIGRYSSHPPPPKIASFASFFIIFMRMFTICMRMSRPVARRPCPHGRRCFSVDVVEKNAICM